MSPPTDVIITLLPETPSGAIDPTPLVTARYPLDRADAALAAAAAGDQVKVLIDCAG